MGNDCSNMCVNDEGQRSLHPTNQIKQNVAINKKQELESVNVNKGHSFHNANLALPDQSRIQKNEDNVV